MFTANLFLVDVGQFVNKRLNTIVDLANEMKYQSPSVEQVIYVDQAR